MARDQLEGFPFHTSMMNLTHSKVFIDGTEYELAAALTSASAGVLPTAVFTRKGDWDASAGSFPGSGSAGIGWQYRCSVAGTVNGIAFSVGDTITALVDGASSSTYAGNWNKGEGAITAAEILAALGSSVGAGNVIGPASATDSTPAVFDGTTGTLLKNVSYATFKTALAIAAADISNASANGRSLITAANYAAMKTLLEIANTDVSGLGTLATQSGTFSGTSSGTNTGDQLVFKTISVSGQSDVVADTETDTLTLVGGTNITITTNAATDTITISASGVATVPDADYGDVVVSSTGAVWTVDANAISNTKLADMATATFKGRVTAGTGDPEDLTGTQATTLLNAFTSALKGLVPASGGGTTNFMRADGTWAAPPASGPVAGSGITVASTTVSINTNNSGGIGAYSFGGNNSGGTLANAATIAGSSIQLVDGSSPLAGTWRNMIGTGIPNGSNGLYMRVS